MKSDLYDTRVALALLVLAAALGAASCGGMADAGQTPRADSPCTHGSKKGCSQPAPTATLSASPASIALGQSSTLSWSSQNATSLTLEPGIGTVAAQGSVNVSPLQTTTYILSATGSGGTTSVSATVTVTEPPPTVSLGATPADIMVGQSATLSWSSQYATSLNLQPGIGTVAAQGSVTVSPQATTTYTLTATGSGGSQSAATAINVAPAGVQLNPGDDIEAAVNANASGTTFVLNPGIYRQQSVAPKDGDVFWGQPGAILDGAILINSWQAGTGVWTAQVSGITQASSYRGQCLSTHPACMYPEDLFFDSQPLTRVASQSLVTTGTWYFDYSTGTAYVGSDPSGHVTELSALAHAFYGVTVNVLIKNLVIEKYAAPSGFAGVQAFSDTRGPSGSWTVDSCEIRFVHGWGIGLSNGTTLNNNKIHDNGQLGFGGSGSPITITNNEIYNNNYAGYDWGWEAGGDKITWSTNVTITGNYAHDNQGPGLWTDINNSYVLYDSNHTARNLMAGIDHEISYQATIRNNLIEDDGFSPNGDGSIWYGGGILIGNSSNVEVYGNTVTNCMNGIGGLNADRGNAPNGTPYLLQNFYVHDNVVTQQVHFAAGIVKAADFDDSVFTSWGNVFHNNTFNLSNTSLPYFLWLDQQWTLDQWNTYWSTH